MFDFYEWTYQLTVLESFELAKQGDTSSASILYKYLSKALKLARDNNQPLPQDVASILIECLDALENEKDANKALMLSGFGRPKNAATKPNVMYCINLLTCPKEWKEHEEAARFATSVGIKNVDFNLDNFYKKFGNTPPDPENPLELKEIFKKVSEIKKQNGKNLSPRTIEDIYYQHRSEAKKIKPKKTNLQKEFLTRKLIP